MKYSSSQGPSQPVAEENCGVFNLSEGILQRARLFPEEGTQVKNASFPPRGLMALWLRPARSYAPALGSWLYWEVGAAPPQAAVFGARVFSSNAPARPAPRASDWLCPSQAVPRPSQLARAVAVARAQRLTASCGKGSFSMSPGLKVCLPQEGFYTFPYSSH